MANTITKINRKLSKITLSDGRRFKAHPEQPGGRGCAGCAFDVDLPCPVDSDGNNRHCNSDIQPGGKGIIWKLRKEKVA